jgi:DNA-binding PucR family transcriptional regulator
VHYRLQRFEKEYQMDLNDGDTRLLLHLWFRLNSLAPWHSLSWQQD